uniref:Cytidyltransferase-like domain-containing protein n=1 Tax=Oryza barthii TaxID=65489 RepID=A0A0D3H5Q6_9ORYZ
MEEEVELPLPTEKLAVDPGREGGEQGVAVLVATGSFNPPTYMHLRMFELAKDELQQRGYCVLGGYMSPVNDAYKKKAMQKGYQRTLTVLSRIRNALCKDGLADGGTGILLAATIIYQLYFETFDKERATKLGFFGF